MSAVTTSGDKEIGVMRHFDRFDPFTCTLGVINTERHETDTNRHSRLQVILP